MTAGSATRARRLRTGDSLMLWRLLDHDPVGNAYLRSELLQGMDGEWWGVLDGRVLRATALGGSLVVPCIPEPADAAPLAEVIGAVALPRMVVGPRASVLPLHHELHRRARDVRDPQPLLIVDPSTFCPQTPAPVRRACRADIDALVTAAAAMHREEMGVDPLAIDAHAWRDRMAGLIDRGWSWVWCAGGRVIFKAELSAHAPDVVQIQGVWTHPECRRRGIATSGLACVCAALLAEVALCTLYVNHYNTIALALYRRLGFRQAGEFATVIY